MTDPFSAPILTGGAQVLQLAQTGGEVACYWSLPVAIKMPKNSLSLTQIPLVGSNWSSNGSNSVKCVKVVLSDQQTRNQTYTAYCHRRPTRYTKKPNFKTVLFLPLF